MLLIRLGLPLLEAAILTATVMGITIWGISYRETPNDYADNVTFKGKVTSVENGVATVEDCDWALRLEVPEFLESQVTVGKECSVIYRDDTLKFIYLRDSNPKR